MKIEHEDKIIKALTDKTWVQIKWILCIGVVFVVIIGLHNPGSTAYGFWKVISSIGCGILLAGASMAAGGFLGFIFGIPSLLQNQNLTTTRQTTFKYNDNLIQISDWLTKIIVGVGLTQLNKIPKKVIQVGVLLQESFGGDIWGRNASLSVIFYFLLFGFLIIYFWTRTDFTSIMKKTDDDINEIKQENIKIKKENEDIKEQVVVSKTKENIDNNNLASDVASVELLSTDTSEAIQNDLNKLKQMAQDALISKPVKVPDDLQKGRWGGKAINNGKKIIAMVSPNKWEKLFDIKIEISATSGEPLNLPAAIFVHNSYKLPDDIIYVKPDDKGMITQTLVGYEAFTIGALLPDGTELELDLNEQPGNPEQFYWGKGT